MKESDRLRIGWLLREGHHPLLTTIYGPFPCYSRWEAWGGVAVLVVVFIVMWWAT